MRQHLLRHLVHGADLDRNPVDVLSKVLALLANLLLFFIVIRGYLIEIFLAIYLFDASERFPFVIG